MKKRSVLIFLFLVFISFVGVAQASWFLAGHVKYSLVESNLFEADEVIAVGTDMQWQGPLDVPYNFTRSGRYTVVGIGTSAFESQAGITSLELSPACRSIGNGAFMWCSGIRSITWRRGLKYIGDNAFRGCSSLGGSLVFPESVKLIAAGAFDQCEKIDSIILPNDLEKLGSRAFNYCHSLKYVKFNGHYLGEIPMECFYDCGELTAVELSINTHIIGEKAFGWCASLPAISLPRTVTEIRSEAFYQCKALAHIYCHATRPPVTQGAFSPAHYSSTTLHVPAASVAAYRASGEWARFANIVADL